MPKPNDTYHVLARKWRPQQFDEVVGQEHITRTLKNAVSSGRIHHALLFIGSRGIGKTTTARILAKALNCQSSDKPIPEPCDKCDNCIEIGKGSHLDVQEIDGASNNSVDNIREIREAVRLAPAHARYKVYIIDEVHQLSSAAFNALLKTLEEPPSHAVFILATTEAHKIPATIISRCQRYDFRRVALPDIVHLLEQIVKAENRKATKEALFAIARSADGGVRDAESILDQLMTYCEGEITYKDVQDVLGLIETDKIDQLVYALQRKDISKVLSIIDEVSTSGKDLNQFVEEFIRHIRNLLILKTTQQENFFFLPEEDIKRLKEQAENFTIIQLMKFVEQLAELNQNFTSQLSHRTALEAFFIKNCKVGTELSIEAILEKLIQLEDAIQFSKKAFVQENRSTYPQQENITEKKTIKTPSSEKIEVKETVKNTSSTLNSGTSIPTTEPLPSKTISGNRCDVDKDFTKKVLRELAYKRATLTLSLKDVSISHDATTETIIIQVKPSDNNALSCLAEGDTKQYILETVNELGFPSKQIQIIQQEMKPYESSIQSPRRGLLKDLVPTELAQEVKQDPKIQFLLNRFKGRIVKVAITKETEEGAPLADKEIVEEEIYGDELDID